MMKTYRKIFLIILIFSAHTANYKAQQLALKNYSIDEGLIAVPVHIMLQDEQHFLWFGTENGVSRYDGINFLNYNTENGLSGNQVFCATKDKSGKIYFGTIKGVSVYSKNTLTHLKLGKEYDDEEIRSIYSDRSGNLWCGLKNGGIIHYSQSKVINYSNKIPNDLVQVIFEDKNGKMWFGTGNSGLLTFDGKKFKGFNKNNGLVNNTIHSIAEDYAANLWIGTAQGISKYNGHKFYNYLNETGLPQSPIYSIIEDKQRNIWLGSYGDGISIYNGDRFVKYNNSNGLFDNRIYNILEDKRGDLWFTTFQGITQLPVEKFINYSKQDGLHSDIVYAIKQDKYGNIWIGTDGGGINVFSNNRFTNYNKKDGLIDNRIASLFIDSKNTIWAGTTEGVSKFDGVKFTNFTKKDGLIDNIIFSIIEDSNNDLWFAGVSGISKYDGKKFISFTSEDGLVAGNIFYIFEDRYQNIWFCSESNGVSKYDGRNFINLTSNDGLSSNNIFSMTQDNRGNYWFATIDKGICSFDGEVFKNYNTNDGLSDNTCYFIIEENEYLYIGTAKGLTRFQPDLLDRKRKAAFKIYTSKDGLAFNDFNQGAFLKDKKGNIWLGTSKGLTYFNTKEVPRLIPPQIYIKKFKVFEQEYSVEQKIELAYSKNYIRIEYLGISYTSHENFIYKYQFGGIDTNWIETSERFVSSFLPPGQYVFKVIAKNDDGIWSKNEAEIAFIIHPPFYATLWFRAILTLLILSGIYFFYIIKTRQVKKRNIELSKMVRARTKELELEKNKSEELLLNILPSSLVEELKKNGNVQPREFKNVSILFTDFKGFSYIAGVLPAEKLVHELNEIFKEFDIIIEKYRLEKLKTIGDSYMVGAGLPEETEDHAIRIINAAFELHQILNKRNKTSAIKWEMRTGVHSGHVIAGVVGTKKFSYDIWGDTVNIASRMESAGAAGEINISAYTYMLVRDHFDCEYRGKVFAKGKGELDMYFVKSIKGLSDCS